MRLSLFALFSFALALPASAQEVPARLTLEDALRIARERNPTYRQVLNDLEVAAADERVGWGAYLPELSANVAFRGSRSQALTGESDFGEPRELDDPVEFTRSSTSQGLGLNYTIFDGGARLNRLRAARAATNVADARIAAEAARLRADVAGRYYAVLEGDRLIELEERLLAAARERLDRTQQMLRVVATGPVDVLGAQVEVARQEQALQRARGEARKARLELLELMGVEREVAFEVDAEPPPVFDPAGLAADALVADALRTSPTILEREAQVSAADRRAGAARGSRWPTVRADAGFSRAMSLSNYGAFFEPNPRNWSFGFGLSASLPLFTQFRNTAEVARADAALEDAEQALRGARLLLEREVRSALIDLRNAYLSLDLADRSAELSRERVELATEQYRAGATTFTELQTMIRQAAEAERGAVAARFGFVRALMTLEQKVGKEVRP